MRRKRGKGHIPSGEARQCQPQIATWVEGRAAALPHDSLEVAVGTKTLARLERFGLAITGTPLLEPERERT
jgi:hypothetical protein